MRQRSPVLSLSIAAILLVVGLATVMAVQPDGQGLVKIAVKGHTDLGRVEASGVPVYARLNNATTSYLLAGATPQGMEALRARGLDVTLLARDTRGASYYLVSLGRPRHWAAISDPVEILYSDGVQAVIRCTQAEARGLAEAGFDIATLSLEPIVLHPRFDAAIPEAPQPDPHIAAMIAQVNPATLYQYEEWLTGEEPVDIGGQPYTIATRHTLSGTPMQKATQFAYEHLADLGLEVEYHQWADATNPNVIATKPGVTDPDDVYIICAHLDDMPASAVAPGADDNASGSTGVLVAAGILSQYDFGCTLKFALWTGEEQGLLGSDAWAEWASDQGLNVLGVLNLDMIAHDSDASPVVDLHARSWLSGSVAMANLFAGVVDVYDINLVPNVLIDHWIGNYTDSKSFWDEGYAGILAIEDYEDRTPYYHTADDRLSTLNMPYFAELVRASLATFAHMNGCLLPEGIGYLDGHVTAADGSQGTGGVPLADATVNMRDDTGLSFLATTDGTGYYTRTLPAGTYTVTATAHGYQPATATGVDILSATVSTQDLYLEPGPTCQPAEILGVTTDVSGCSLTFSSQVTGTEPITYLWEFDPGGTTSDPAPVVELVPGSYSVTLHVWNCGTAGYDVQAFPVDVACWRSHLPLILRDR